MKAQFKVIRLHLNNTAMFSKLLKNRLLLNLCLVLLFLNFATARFSPKDTRLIFYYGPQFNDFEVYELADATQMLKNPHFNKNETHLYIHGFGESPTAEGNVLIVNAYLKRKDINLIVLDWAKVVGENYFSALSYFPEIVSRLSDAITNLFKAGIDRKKFTVVAHSLGAQLAGMTSRNMMEKTNVKIHRMAVLDAAFPLFFTWSVSKDDADFLQAIHTDIGTYGQPKSLGHVDFWPNGGRQGQPGCPQGIIIPLSPEDLCSHQRSWRFWAESVANINNGPRFVGFASPTYLQFLIAGADNLNKKTAEMGIDCSMNSRGDFYLKTNSQPLFAKGMDGYY